MTKVHGLEATEMQASGMQKELLSEEINCISHKQQVKAVRKPTQPNSNSVD